MTTENAATPKIDALLAGRVAQILFLLLSLLLVIGVLRDSLILLYSGLGSRGNFFLNGLKRITTPSGLPILLSLALCITTILWLYRSHVKMTRMDGKASRFKSYWTIIGFFIPIVNLFRPIQVVSELWNANVKDQSHKNESNPTNATGDKSAAPAIIIIWWVLLVLYPVPRLITSTIFRMDTSSEAIGTGIVQSIMLCISALLATVIIERITFTQNLENEI